MDVGFHVHGVAFVPVGFGGERGGCEGGEGGEDRVALGWMRMG